MFRSLWPRRWLAIAALCLAASLSLDTSASAQPALSFQPVVSGLASPLGIVNAHDGSNRLFILEKGGLIRIYNGTQILATPFLDLSAKILTDSERGLLGLAFDANYLSNGLFYVYYTSKPSGAITISRYSVSASSNVADPEFRSGAQDAGPFAIQQPRWRLAAVWPGWLPLRRHRRRRQRRRSQRQRTKPQHAAGQDHPHQSDRRRGLHRCAGQSVCRPTPTSATKSGRSACAIPGASPSTA